MSSINQFNSFNSPSLNGLIDINADNVNTSSLVVNDVDIGAQIEENTSNIAINANKLTGITYIATPTPTTKFVNDIDETGTIYIREASNPNVIYMKIKYEPSLFGFCFTDETPGRSMNFRVKNSNGVGYKLFYFASSQLYASMLTYIDNWLAISYSNRFVMGDANSAGVWYGNSMQYIPNTATTSGLVFYNKGLNNNAAYYTNFTHNDLFNVQLYTFRMCYNNIWSLVNHNFTNILVSGTSNLGNSIITGTLSVSGISTLSNTSITTLGVSGISTLSTINGTSLYISGSSTFGNTISADSISVLNSTNLNGNLNAISTSNFIGTATFIGSAIFNNSVVCNNSFNAGSGTFTGSLTTNSSFTCGSISCAGNIVSYGNLNLSGTSSFSGTMSVYNTITCDNNFTQVGTTASTNRIIQPRIYGDVLSNANILKYTQIRYNSGSTTPSPALQLVDDVGGYCLNFAPNVGGGAYGNIVQTNDRVIIAVNGTGTASALVLSSYGPTGAHGIRINHASTTDYTTQIWANTYSFKVNSLTGITATGPVTCSSTLSVSGAVSLGTTTLLNNNILQYGSSIISQDMIGTYSGTNQLKLTNIIQNTTTSGTSTPALVIRDDYNANALFFLPNSGTSSYNSLSSINSQSIIARGPSGDNASFVLSVWATVKNGMKIFTTGSSHAQTELWAGNTSNIILNNSTGITVNNVASITFTDSSVQTKAFNSTNAGYTLSGSTLTFPTNTVINCAVGGIGNEIKCHKFNCYNVIEFPDTSIQNTAYTTAKDTKLNAIGSVTIATLTASTLLTTNTFFNCGSMTLSAGTYILTLNCGFIVVTSATTIGQMLLSHSTSPTALTSNANLNIDNKLSVSVAVNTQLVMPNQAIVSPTTSTTYYMLCQVAFGTASRLQFVNGTSSFQAVRIA